VHCVFISLPGGHPLGKPGEPGKVREWNFKVVRENGEKSEKMCSCLWVVTICSVVHST